MRCDELATTKQMIVLNDVQTFGNWKKSFRIYFDMEIDNTMRLVADGNFDSIAAARKKE